MLAMVALLTGGFLVYSAQSLSVTLRRPQFALVRVLGLARRGLLNQLFIEGALVGLAGAALGVVFGLGLAGLALRAFGGDLGGGFFPGSPPHLAFSPGAAAAMPWLARAIVTPLRRLRDPPPSASLALDRLWGAPGQAAIALCGIVASVSLMVAMAVMVASFRGSVEDWLTQVLPSDLYLPVEGGEGGLHPAAQARLAALPRGAPIRFRRTALLPLSPDP